MVDAVVVFDAKVVVVGTTVVEVIAFRDAFVVNAAAIDATVVEVSIL